MRTWEYPEPSCDRLNARHTGSTSGRIPVRNPRTCSVRDKSDAGLEWLPPNRDFQCTYIARYLAVAVTYDLNITTNDRDIAVRQCPAIPGGAV